MATAIKQIKNKILRILNRFILILLKISSKLGKDYYQGGFFENQYNDLMTYNRDYFIIEICKNKRVLHFGFLDYPITEQKLISGELLHGKLTQCTEFLFGVDIDKSSIDLYRKITGDFNNIAANFLNHSADVSVLKNQFDVILFPEVLEHLKNPGEALLKLKEIGQLNPSSKIVFTVPNAYSYKHFMGACLGTELVHPDHYFYFSPTTVGKLLNDSGLKNVAISLYSWGNARSPRIGITENGIIATCNA